MRRRISTVAADGLPVALTAAPLDIRRQKKYAAAALNTKARVWKEPLVNIPASERKRVTQAVTTNESATWTKHLSENGRGRGSTRKLRASSKATNPGA
jgi:hypothetical protein